MCQERRLKGRRPTVRIAGVAFIAYLNHVSPDILAVIPRKVAVVEVVIPLEFVATEKAPEH